METMANRVLSRCNSKQVVIFQNSLSSLNKFLRQLSQTSLNNNSVKTSDIEKKSQKFPVIDISQSLLAPRDLRVPLPGNVGVEQSLLRGEISIKKSNKKCDVLTCVQSHERHLQALAQYFNPLFPAENELTNEELQALGEAALSRPSDVLECLLQDCPDIMKLDFVELFPKRDIMSQPLTVVILSQKTQNDMTAWSSEVQLERDELAEVFVEAATEICNQLQYRGFWCDYIDPTSGQPQFSPSSDATFYETDERYRHFGFEIEDLGCCKLINHHKWGSNAFVGCLFTNTPIDDPHLRKILESEKYSVESK